MPNFNSPLRFPGGKGHLAAFISEIITFNRLRDGAYFEPFAGGAGVALHLLFSEIAQEIFLNDADKAIYSFWKSILTKTDSLIALIENTPVTIEEWKKQREVYQNQSRPSILKLGFATFFLNRCNRSGILGKAGPIGGYQQTGKWKIDARYNKANLIKRIKKIALYKDRIKVYNKDAVVFLKQSFEDGALRNNGFVYLDPPYYQKGKKLYLNHFTHSNHEELAKFIKIQNSYKWLITYDNTPEIRSIYNDINQIPYEVRYTASYSKTGTELLIFNDNLLMPEQAKNLFKTG